MAVQSQKWVALYQLALLEQDPSQMATRLLTARHEIFNRVEELRDLPGPHDTENQAIQEALKKMHSLHVDQQVWASNKREGLGRTCRGRTIVFEGHGSSCQTKHTLRFGRYQG
jgi:hypothetical protein